MRLKAIAVIHMEKHKSLIKDLLSYFITMTHKCSQKYFICVSIVFVHATLTAQRLSTLRQNNYFFCTIHFLTLHYGEASGNYKLL